MRFKLLSYERQGKHVVGYAKASSSLYRFRRWADGVMTISRVKNGKIADKPSPAPRTEALIRKALDEKGV